MSSPQIQLRRSTRKSILPSSQVKSNVNKLTPILIPVKHQTPIAPRSIQEFTGDFKKLSDDFKDRLATPKGRFKATPKTSDYFDSNAIRVDPVMARLQRDLNSPSAGARVRANKALKSPNFRKQVYEQFDVPHERQDLVTDEERKSMKAKTIEEIFRDCKVYVEVRSGDDNRSAGIKSRLLRDGINVNEKLYKDTTHVIFKDGLLSTYKNATKLGIPVTTVLWIDACKAQKRLVDPGRFKISNLDRYNNPELYPRLRRQKSMQPEVRTSGNSLMKSMIQEEQKQKDETNFNEVDGQKEEMDLTLQNEKLENTSCSTPQPMEVEEIDKPFDIWKRDHRRITTFTPNMMEQTGVAGKLMLDRRRTLFASQTMQQSVEASSPESRVYNAFKNNSMVFNSANRIDKNSRRSVFDISMNILDLNCKAISKQSKEQLPSSAIKTTPSNPNYNHDHQVSKPQVIRKRKLFTDDYETVDDFKENHKTFSNSEKKPKIDRTLVSSYPKTPQPQNKTKPKTDRRNTLAYFKSEKPKRAVVRAKTPVKPATPSKIVVCTNMSQTDKKIIQAAIVQLGGKVEAEVTNRTSHVVTPNEERTMNVLRGVVLACAIVNVNWIHESLAANTWLESDFYLHDICDSNRVYERSVLGTKNYRNLTFSNVSFFFNKQTIDNAKKVEYMREVIILCSGTVTENESEAKIIVSDQPCSSNNSKQAVVNSIYVFDSAMKGTCLNTLRYTPRF